MTNSAISSLPQAIVLDASITIAITAKEPTEPTVSAEVNRFLANGAEFFAPGVLVSETLYVLCGKQAAGTLSATAHAQAIQDFYTLMTAFVLPPPQGEASLILRAEAIRGSYVCNRSADGLYLALAESLSQTHSTLLLTLDKELPKQAAKNAPTVTVRLL